MDVKRKGFCLLGTIIVIAVVVASCPTVMKVVEKVTGMLG